MKKLNQVVRPFLMVFVSIILLGYAKKVNAQAFPVKLNANGGEVKIESIDVDSYGDIYVTGVLGQYGVATFAPSPCSGFDKAIGYTASGPSDKSIFVAKLHADDGSYAATDVVWMVVGNSSLSSPTTEFSGNDIEVDSDGNVYFTGTLFGDVEFERIIGGSPSPIYSCAPSGSSYKGRHFVARIDNNGTPLWVAEAESEIVSSFGEGITLEEESGKLYTGGYLATNYYSEPVWFRNEDCTGGCSINSTPATPTGNVGFVAEYYIDGTAGRVERVGEKVMALTKEEFSEKVYVTGSTVGADVDVLLAVVLVNPSASCTFPAINYVGTGGSGGDIGLDIAFTSDDKVALTGAFTSVANFPPFGLSTIAGNSEIFVSIFDPGTGTFSAASEASALPSVPGSSSDPANYLERNSCIAAEMTIPGGGIFQLGYDKNSFDLLTSELRTNLTLMPGTNWDVISNTTSAYRRARAMEIEYGNSGTSGDRYMGGDFIAPMRFGSDVSDCEMNASGIDVGYVVRMDNTNNMMRKKSQLAEELNSNVFELYPNPASTDLTVKLSDSNSKSSIEILNLQGAVVYQKELSNMNQIKIDISEFSTGVYMVKLKTANEINLEKLIIK